MRIQLSDHFTYRKLARFVLPSVVMMVFTSIYGVVDGLFVSNCVGKTAFAAINLVMPFIMVLGGIGFMVGTGGTALVAKVLGEKDREKANRYFSMMIYLTLALGVFFTVLGIVFMKDVAVLLGASEEMLPHCVAYGRTVIGFTTAFMLQNVFQSFLIAAEKPKLGLFVTLAAGIGNMVLDALLVGVFHWGVIGAAAATGLSQCIGGVLPLIYFLRPNDSLLRLVPARPELRAILQACFNGSSELMSNIASSVVGMLKNIQLMKLAGENGVSAYGVLMYVQFIFISVFIGYSIGCAPVISYHYGAQNREEMRNLLKKSIRIMLGIGVLMAASDFLMAPLMAKAFVGYDQTLTDMTVHAFRVFAPTFLMAGLNIFASSFFTALNNGKISAAISFLRTLVFQSSFVLLLPRFFGLDGVWMAVPIAEVFALTLSVIFLVRCKKQYGY